MELWLWNRWPKGKVGPGFSKGPNVTAKFFNKKIPIERQIQRERLTSLADFEGEVATS